MANNKNFHSIISSHLKKLSLLLGSVALCLIMVEGGTRLFAPLAWKHTLYMERQIFYQHHPEWTEHDPVLGFRNIPDKQITIKRPQGGEFEIEIAINSAGFRDDEDSLRDADILLLGDSFGFGWGVEKAEGVEERLEKETGRKVLNLSVSGYGTAQQYLLLRRWSESHDLHGKDVVILFYENDWVETLGDCHPVYPAVKADSQGNATYGKVPFEVFAQFHLHSFWNRPSALARSSDLLLATRTALRNRKFRKANPEAKPLDLDSLPTPKMEQTMRLVLKDLVELQNESGFILSIAHIPPFKSFKGSEWNGQKALAKLAREKDIPLIGLSETIDAEDYWPVDWHWKQSGHKKAATAIAAFLQANVKE